MALVVAGLVWDGEIAVQQALIQSRMLCRQVPNVNVSRRKSRLEMCDIATGPEAA
jgi:hypothetical protein